MPCKLAVISDIHYGTACKLPQRKSEIADILLKRAVHRLVKWVRPDVVAVLGDCVDDAAAPDCMERLERLRSIFSVLECPVIVVRGNHDPEPERFYQVFPQPPDFLDIADVRFVPFIDPDRPGYNAERLPHQMERLRSCRGQHAGPIVTLQHVPVLPPGTTRCRYNYTNVTEILDVMAEQKITLAVSGHEHKGTDLVHHNGSTFVTVKALCEEPFAFSVIEIDADDVNMQYHYLQMPPQLQLVDAHIHTQYSYCGPNMEMVKSVELAQYFGLAGLVLSEHSGQLYYSKQAYWNGTCCKQGIAGVNEPDVRIHDYFKSGNAINAPWVYTGLEVDCDYQGQPVVRTDDRKQARFINGAQHHLPEQRKEHPIVEQLADEFLYTLQTFIQSSIHALAHPFRIFERAKLAVPECLYTPVIQMLRENNVAAEINFHTNTPDPIFFRRCIESGVKLTLGSDAHELHLVGELTPHLAFLHELGCAANLDEVLLPI